MLGWNYRHVFVDATLNVWRHPKLTVAREICLTESTKQDFLIVASGEFGVGRRVPDSGENRSPSAGS